MIDSEIKKNFKRRIIENLKLISSPDELREYQKNVPFVNVPDEVLCQWFDDLNMPESLDHCSELLLPEQISALRKFCDIYDRYAERIREGNISLEEQLASKDWKQVEAAAILALDALGDGT